jgi:hypothetical protein
MSIAPPGCNEQRTTVVGENSSIASGEIKSARVPVADEDSRPTFAFVEVKPLLGLQAMRRCRRPSSQDMPYRRMPMQLAQALRLQHYERGGYRCRNRKIGRIDLVKEPSTSWDLLRLVLESMVYIGAISNQRAIPASHIGLANGAIDDVGIR